MAFPLDKPGIGSTNWGDTVNNNWDTLNSAFMFWSKIVTSTKISIIGAASATLNRLHVISGTSADYIITISGLSPSMGDVLGFYVADYGSANKQFRLDAGGSVKIAGRTQYLTLLHTNVVLLMWDGTDWQPLVLCLDTPWVDAGTTTITATTTNPTKGTIIRDKQFWRRISGDMGWRWEYGQSAAGANGSGDYLITIPFGTMDSTKVQFNTSAFPQSAQSTIGTGAISSDTTFYGITGCSAYNSTNIRACKIITNGGGTTGSSFWRSAGSTALGMGEVGASAQCLVPMTNW